jgi:hypothetical protein
VYRPFSRSRSWKADAWRWIQYDFSRRIRTDISSVRPHLFIWQELLK